MYVNFIAKLKTDFSPIDTIGNALEKIHNLQQGLKTANEHIAEFKNSCAKDFASSARNPVKMLAAG